MSPGGGPPAGRPPAKPWPQLSLFLKAARDHHDELRVELFAQLMLPLEGKISRADSKSLPYQSRFRGTATPKVRSDVSF